MTDQEEFQQSSPIEIRGEGNVFLRQLFIEDAQAYFDLIEYDRAHLTRFNDSTAEKYPDVAAVIRSIVMPNPETPGRLRFGIWSGDTMVGSNNLTPLGADKAETGSWIGKEHTGHGYAAKARDLLVAYAFYQLGISEIISKIAIGNEASRRSVERSGYKFVGEELGQWIYVLEKKTPDAP